MYLIIVISYVIFISLIMVLSQFQIGYLFDVPSLICLFVILIPVILGTGTKKDLRNAFRMGFSRNKSYSLIELKRAGEAVSLCIKMLFLTAGLVALLECVMLLHQMTALEQLGPICATIILIMLYGVFFSMLLLPLKVIINNRIISYMDESEAEEVTESEDMGQRIYYRLRSFGLTDREAEVARLISTGMSNKEIAKELFITKTTVKKHVTHILEKMKLDNRDELTQIVKKI